MLTKHYLRDGKVYLIYHATKGGAEKWEHAPGKGCKECDAKTKQHGSKSTGTTTSKSSARKRTSKHGTSTTTRR